MIPRPRPSTSVPPAPDHQPGALAAIPPARHVSLDVRETIRRGEEPFPIIMAAVAGLAPDQVLALRAPFEPIPLYRVLDQRGFAHWTERHADDDWTVWFYRGASASAVYASSSSGPRRD